MAADCKSATLRVTEVRILPCAPFILFDVVVAGVGECCGSKPGRQRKDGNCAGCAGIVGGCSLANDGAGQVPATYLDPVRFFCLSCHTRTDAFAVRLSGREDFQQVVSVTGWRSSVVEHSLGKGEVESSSLSVSSRHLLHGPSLQLCPVEGSIGARSLQVSGSNSVVESQPSKLLVAGPIPVSRSKDF